MKRFFLPFLLSAALVAGCSDEPAPVTPGASADVLMELKLGNRWIGRTVDDWQGSQIDTLRIVSDRVVGAEHWYLSDYANPQMMGRPDMVYGPWIMNRADGLYTDGTLSAPEKTAIRRVKYPVSLGDTVTDEGWYQIIYPNGSPGPRLRYFTVATALQQQVTVGAGSFTSFKVAYGSQVDPADSIGYEPLYDTAWYAPGPGLLRAVKYDASGAVTRSWELIGLTLN